uniref:Uncharacterized protein n=1 Tax=Anser brachyrhynchus TaxID=132585 RepID=A0A8B9BZB6_9AVES
RAPQEILGQPLPPGWGTRPEARHGAGCDGRDHSAQPWVLFRIYRECFSRNHTFQVGQGVRGNVRGCAGTPPIAS